MARLELQAFEDKHVEPAARLLEARHAAHRSSEPLLAEADADAAVERAWAREGTSGAVAIRDGEVVGYVLGNVAERRYVGFSAWIERAGHGAAEPEVLRDLYAKAADAWVQAGADRHYAVVPVLADQLDPWYRLGLAQMHMEALRESGGEAREPPPGVTIRSGGPDDAESAAIPINHLIMELQARSPSYLPIPISEEEERADWAETFADPGVAYFVAERAGRVVGHSLLYPPDPDVGIDAGSVYLASTGTIAEVRGTGVGLALTAHVLAWAREAGYRTVVTNWRVTNLLASRFWPARGFRPTFVRLYRAIGEG
jgi:GNAT superfamily N-acetyltransferase